MFIGGVDGSLLTTETDKDLLIVSILYAFLFSIVVLNILVAVIFDAWGKVSPFGELYFWRFRHGFLIETSEITLPWCGKIESSFMQSFEDHAKKVLNNFEDRPRQASKAESIGRVLREVLLYVSEALYLVFLFLFGLLTLSFFWPEPFRRFFFTVGQSDAAREDEEVDGVVATQTTKAVQTGKTGERQEDGALMGQLMRLEAKIVQLTQAVDDLKKNR